MRSHRLLLPLTVALALGSAAPAMADAWSADASNYKFEPGTRSIEVVLVGQTAGKPVTFSGKPVDVYL